jgi:hypothetical protein
VKTPPEQAVLSLHFHIAFPFFFFSPLSLSFVKRLGATDEICMYDKSASDS